MDREKQTEPCCEVCETAENLSRCRRCDTILCDSCAATPEHADLHQSWVIEHATRRTFGALDWHRADGDDWPEYRSLDAALEAVAGTLPGLYRVVRLDGAASRVVWEGEPEDARRWLTEHGPQTWDAEVGS